MEDKTLFQRAVALGAQKDEKYEICAWIDENKHQFFFKADAFNSRAGEPLTAQIVPSEWSSMVIIDAILTHFERKQVDANGLLPCPYCRGKVKIESYCNFGFGTAYAKSICLKCKDQ